MSRSRLNKKKMEKRREMDKIMEKKILLGCANDSQADEELKDSDQDYNENEEEEIIDDSDIDEWF